jgi:hypothetical protein
VPASRKPGGSYRSKNGSVFTQNFTAALHAAIDKQPNGEKYLPWHQLLKKAANLAHKEAQQYDIGAGKPGLAAGQL